MQKYYCPEWTLEGIFYLSEEESRHCISVMRNQAGATLGILDGKGTLLLCEIVLAHPKKTGLKVLEKLKEEATKPLLHIAISPTKNNDRIEFFIEKACEIGLGVLTPILFDRTERAKINLDRWVKIAHAACKQSGQLHFPTIEEPIRFDKFMSTIELTKTGFTVIGSANTLRDIGAIETIVIGPEGDYSPNEYERMNACKIKDFSLGNSILRVETAGLVAVSQWNFINQPSV